MARTRRWWDGVPPVRAPVDCDGARHHVAWRGGRIVLEDHGNPTDERALVALGARRSACVDVVEAWREAVADGGFLHEWAVHEFDDPARHRLFQARWSLAARGEAQDILRHLAGDAAVRAGKAIAVFPQAMQDRLGLAVARRLERQWHMPSRPDDLYPVRARSAFVRSLALVDTQRRPAALIPFSCVVAAPPAAPSMNGRLAPGDASARLTVGPSWLTEVWGRGLSVVDGQLVLRLLPSRNGAAVMVEAVRWQRDPDDVRVLVPGLTRMVAYPAAGTAAPAGAWVSKSRA